MRGSPHQRLLAGRVTRLQGVIYFIESLVPGPFPCFSIRFFSIKSVSIRFTVGLGIANFFAISPDLQPKWLPIKVKIDFSFGDNCDCMPLTSSFSSSWFWIFKRALKKKLYCERDKIVQYE